MERPSRECRIYFLFLVKHTVLCVIGTAVGGTLGRLLMGGGLLTMKVKGAYILPVHTQVKQKKAALLRVLDWRLMDSSTVSQSPI